jgi:uncharacterized protein
MLEQITRSPALVRVVPFALFIGLTFLQDKFGDTGRYWIYLAKTLVAAGLLLAVFRHIAELEWRFTWEAFAVGIAVFVMWVGVDELFARAGITWHRLKSTGPAWNPNAEFGEGSMLAIFFIATRLLGSSLVVPMLEEVFYRSFVYRYLIDQNFLTVPLSRYQPLSVLITSLVFAFSHVEWFAGLLCGIAYQALVIWKGRLGDAITAHGVTNLLLAIWIVWRGAWQFW